ncbi:lysophospholipid acyltransferase family protein [Acidicapsa dinghuensis]|uniref:Lysophospholipid acyltransferase family protein n=1 Tax=Acidicapsa dinghuensis TaxID=2218256 RepID=A0ABW1E9R0_9BACT|nr:lysophospholipid acyltransferase family protein [Acidicapsa dinghuensis]
MRPRTLPLMLRIRSNIMLAPVFFLGTAFFGSIALVASLFDKSGRVQHRVAQLWARFSVACSLSRVRVIGVENLASLFPPQPPGSKPGDCIPCAQPCVFAANHTSYMDTPVVFSSLPVQFRILAKKELFGLPFIGWYLTRSGQLPIDTANPRATLSSFAAGVRTLRAGLSVFVFPEGARTPTGELQSFLNGAAFLAIRAKAPLVPIALIGVYDLLPIHTRHFYPSRTPIKLVFGRPISTEGHSPRESEALTEELRNAIDDLIQQHRS